MACQIKKVSRAKEKKLFIDLEWKLNKDCPNWISPLRMERKRLLDTKKNPFFQHSQIELFIAYKGKEAVGRIAAITNENHNKFQNDNAGFWGFFECIDEQETADALFDAAAAWLREQGKDNMYGPMNPSTNDEVGILIDGFETPPYMMMTQTHPYYQRLAENYGHEKAKDLYAWIVPVKEAQANVTEKMRRVSGKIMKKYNIRLRNMEIKNLREEIKIIKDIYNDAWSRNWGFVPFTDAEIDNLADDLKPVADQDLLFFGYKDDKPIAFSLTLPNVNEILRNIPNGRLFPFGLFKLLFGMKKIKSVRVLVLGVKKEFQYIGLGSIFYLKSIENALARGYTMGEMSWILEDNHAMNRAIEAIGSKKYKTYRIYQYALK